MYLIKYANTAVELRETPNIQWTKTVPFSFFAYYIKSAALCKESFKSNSELSSKSSFE